GRVFDPGVEEVASASEPQGDGVRRAPLVERAGVEEADQHVELAAGTGECAGGGQRVLKRRGCQSLGVVSRLGGGGDEAAHLSELAARVSRGAVAKVLPHGPRCGNRGTVLATFPTRVAIKALGPLLGRSEAQGAGQEQRGS